ncbi:MAG: ribonuclease HII [Candidatus Babeliales bacterium]
MKQVILNPSTLITGIDDATKCPVIGSIMIAGVVADPATVALWHEKGVKDSKLIARKKRDELAKLIKETAIAFSVRKLKPHMIDNKALNLNAWEMLVVCKIVEDLQKQTSTELGSVIIDNWEVSEKLFFERFNHLLSKETRAQLDALKVSLKRRNLRKVHFIPEHRADENHTIVGAASILAKSASDLEYERLKKRYGNFGSGSPGDPKTRLYVWKHRHKPTPIIRTSWNTFKTLSIIDSIEQDWLFIARNNKKQSF